MRRGVAYEAPRNGVAVVVPVVLHPSRGYPQAQHRGEVDHVGYGAVPGCASCRRHRRGCGAVQRGLVAAVRASEPKRQVVKCAGCEGWTDEEVEIAQGIAVDRWTQQEHDCQGPALRLMSLP